MRMTCSATRSASCSSGSSTEPTSSFACIGQGSRAWRRGAHPARPLLSDSLHVTNPHAAGIDIHLAEHWVAVPVGSAPPPPKDHPANLPANVRRFGTNTAESTDYPDYARPVGEAVAHGQADRGILVCGSGVGMAIAANKIHGIRAAMGVSPEEVTALVADRHLVHDTHHCPHGRPTALVFTREELDKQFKRT